MKRVRCSAGHAGSSLKQRAGARFVRAEQHGEAIPSPRIVATRAAQHLRSAEILHLQVVFLNDQTGPTRSSNSSLPTTDPAFDQREQHIEGASA